ncbi:MAG: AbrB/MazE/SpoVT family DNA-binding domain-containing protein [Kiritimatiellae bacterium]|nr:AbrB/MazE/SpoVT family DNA-binding domain-containing protein [Kiritimatiellia bacterium]
MAAKRRRKHGSGLEVQRKLTRTAKYTYYVTIPKTYIRTLGWRERQRVKVRMEGEEIVIAK